MRRTTILVVCSLAVGLCAGAAFAQSDTLKIDYFANANTSGAPDATVRLTNPGTSPGDVCADIFVFDPNQELSECCSCLLTPDGLREIWVGPNLTDNPLTGVTLNTGLFKFVSAKLTNGTCPLPTAINPTPALRAWVTHIQNSTLAETETAASDATLSANELLRLDIQCFAVGLVGSGKGVCSCGTGD